jgi:uncharacterized protein (DUF1015 family)
MGLLNRAEAAVFPHEETRADRVAQCARTLASSDCDPGSLWLWCEDPNAILSPLLETTQAPDAEASDRFGCLHQIWRLTSMACIRDIQSALEGKPLFLADGHHRFAAGWNLATIQIRTGALRSLPSHHLVGAFDRPCLPEMQPVEDVGRYLANPRPGHSRFVVVTPGPVFRGFEAPRSFHVQDLLRDTTVQHAREMEEAIGAVESGRASMALLVAPLEIGQIETDARRGILLPPKSTDFFPKLAAGLVVHRHQNESETPATAQRPGVR